MYFSVNFTWKDGTYVFGRLPEPRFMDGLAIYTYDFVEQETRENYEISLRENTVRQALELIGWDRHTMKISCRYQGSDQDLIVDDLLLLDEPGNHPVMCFTISYDSITK